MQAQGDNLQLTTSLINHHIVVANKTPAKESICRMGGYINHLVGGGDTGHWTVLSPGAQSTRFEKGTTTTYR